MCYYRLLMNKTLTQLAFLGILALGFSGCDNGASEKKSGPEQATDTAAAAESQASGFDVMSGDYYQVPSPNELFLIIKNSELPYKEGLIDSKPTNYTSSKQQALNFGRLTADIAYTASYEKFQESIDNFENLRKLASDLGISYVFDELMVNRVKSNMDNADSLEIISNSSYINIIGQLEANGEGVTLAIISVGGFVESIYLLSQLIGEYEEGSAVIQRLADQKLVMENIIDYLNQYSDEAKVREVIDELKPISDIYLNLKEKEMSPAMTEREGKKVLGGQAVVISKEEFEALMQVAKEYRDSFSNANNTGNL